MFSYIENSTALTEKPAKEIPDSAEAIALPEPVVSQELSVMKRKDRKPEISILNVAFCLIVIFIHVTSAPVTQLDKTTWQFAAVLVPWRLSAFVTQGFILLSGIKLFLGRGKNIDYRKFYLSRLYKIVIPYILCVAAYYIFFCVYGYYTFHLPELVRFIFIGDLAVHFYFIIVIVQFYLLAPLWIKAVKKADPAMICVFALMTTIISNQYLPNIVALFLPDYYFPYAGRLFSSYLIYWIGGCLIGLYYEVFSESVRKNRTAITVWFAASATSNAILSYLHFSGKKTIDWLEIIHLMYCLSAVIFAYSTALLIKDTYRGGYKAVFFLDSVTYPAYLIHVLIIYIVNYGIDKLGITRISVMYAIRAAGATILTFSISILYKILSSRLKKQSIPASHPNPAET